MSADLIQKEMEKDWPICKGENLALKSLRRARGFHQDDLFCPHPFEGKPCQRWDFCQEVSTLEEARIIFGL